MFGSVLLPVSLSVKGRMLKKFPTHPETFLGKDLQQFENWNGMNSHGVF
jgi:hypothetical protein